jgi:hypothetical protein
MPEQVKQPNPWRKVMMMIIIIIIVNLMKYGHIAMLLFLAVIILVV